MTIQQEENIEDIISYFAISLFGQNTVEDILWDLTKNCISRLGFEDCVIYLIDEKREILVQKAAYGPKNPKDFTINQPIGIPLGQGIVGHVALTGTAEIVNDTSKDPRYIQDDAFRYSEISVPIVLENKVIGVIDSEHTMRNFFTLYHLKSLRLIAALCANKIKSAQIDAIRKNNEQTLQEVQRKLSGLSLQALRAQMNPHFIFNALNAIQHFITEKRTEEALKYLSLFGGFIRKILDSSVQLYMPIVIEMEILKNYLELEKMRFGQQFDFSINANSVIDIHNAEIPVFLIQPFVERSLMEGILNRRKKGFLDIFFDQDEHHIICTIKNNLNETGVPDLLSISGRGTYQMQSWWEIQERIDLINRHFHDRIQIKLLGTHIEIIILKKHDN